MVHAFTDNEKGTIKELIVQRGRELFLNYGFKKTSIDDIVEDLPIAKGTFYSFFASKEDLYIEIIKKEEIQFKEKLLSQEFFNKGNSPVKIISGFLRFAVNEVETNNIWRSIVSDSNQLPRLRLKLVDENKKYKFDYSWDIVLSQFKLWSEEGLVVDKDPELMAHITRSLYYITFFKKEIGTKHFKGVMDFLIETISHALVKN